jgi:DNA-binding MarR family transcriptional regulator
MVGILDALSERGLLKRERSPHDRREYYVQLTRKGMDMLAEIQRMAFEVEDLYQEKTGLTDEERETILPILRKITNRYERLWLFTACPLITKLFECTDRLKFKFQI